MSVGRFTSVPSMLEAIDPSFPIYCFYKDRLLRTAQDFVAGFPGKVLFAVKCNPHPYVLKSLWEAGVKHFDTASLKEIATVTELLPEATCYFNHPVKSRAAIDSAFKIYGVDVYVVDHPNELKKLVDIVGTDIIVQVRIETASGYALHDLSAKFGADEEQAVALLKQAKELGTRTAISFHVGSQCTDPNAYREAIKTAGRVQHASGVEIEFLNVGGGFPAEYRGFNAPSLHAFFNAIGDGKKEAGFDDQLELLCEPGRALVWNSSSIVSQVHLRKESSLYLNDGIYGCMFEIRESKLTPPVKPYRKGGEPIGGDFHDFHIFGPTCDSSDHLPLPFRLPSEIREMDWLEIAQMGAYSVSNKTDFNGFDVEAFAEIAAAPS